MSAEELRAFESQDNNNVLMCPSTGLKNLNELLALFRAKTNENKENISRNIDSSDLLGSPAIEDTHEARIDRRTCILPGCKDNAKSGGLCRSHHNKIVKYLSPLQLALVNQAGDELVESRRHERLSAFGDSWVSELYQVCVHDGFTPFFFRPDGKDGFFVASGYAPLLPGEVTKQTHFMVLSGMMRRDDPKRLLRELEKCGFHVPEEKRAYYLGLQQDESIPRNWPFPHGIEFVRDTPFRAGQPPHLGESAEARAKKNQNQNRRRAEIRAAKESGTVVVKKRRAKGITPCENCGRNDVKITRGRCDADDCRTEKSHPSCKFTGCETWKGLKKGFCKKHGEKCSVRGCTFQIVKAGMCRGHYNKYHNS